MAINLKRIPLDKSWYMRLGVLDLIHGLDQIVTFLESQSDLSDDLKALLAAAKAWRTSNRIDVGESATLLRLLRAVSWRFDLNKTFKTRRTLRKRLISNDPRTIDLPQEESLELDTGEKTSQWATAIALLGDTVRLIGKSYKLDLTHEAIDYWEGRRKAGLPWEVRLDQTILAQAEALDRRLSTGVMVFTPEQAEDYCFAFAFGLITAEEGQRRWATLPGHESNRIVEMTKQLARAKAGRRVTSRDHRVVQAIAMWAAVNHQTVKFAHPECVAKSWPLFWEFLADVTGSH